MAGGLERRAGRICNEGARFRRLARVPASRYFNATSDGHRNGRIHGHVICHGLRGPWPDPGDGVEVLVTGAAGGVGSIAVSILAELGYNV